MSENSCKITGTIKEIRPVEQVTETFKKRTIVLIYKSGNYDKTAAFELQKDRCELADSLNVGDTLTVHFNPESRYWEKGDRYFDTNVCWKIEAKAAAYTPPPPTQTDPNNEDLPF
jgi:hypothetical protein